MNQAKMKIVYVITGRGERKFWNRVGVAFENRDGSLNCKLDTLPINGEIHIRDYVARPEHDSTEQEFSGPRALAG